MSCLKFARLKDVCLKSVLSKISPSEKRRGTGAKCSTPGYFFLLSFITTAHVADVIRDETCHALIAWPQSYIAESLTSAQRRASHNIFRLLFTEQ